MKYVYTFIIIILLISNSFAQEKVGQNAGVRFSASPYVNSLGGASINLLNEEAIIYNPGAMAVFHSDKFLSISFPFTVDYSPIESVVNERYDFSMSVGITLNQLLHREDEPIDFGVAIGLGNSKSTVAYSIRDLFDVYDYKGIDKQKYYSFGAMLKTQIFRIGIGYTQIETKTDLVFSDIEPDDSYEEVSNEYGFYIDAPIALGDMSTGSFDDISVSLTPSLAFSRKNLNIDIAAVRPASYLGFSALLEGKKERFNDFSFMFVVEYDKPDNYTDTIDYIIVQVPFEYQYEWNSKWGIELGVYDIVTLRFGRNESFDDASFGLGLSAKRIINSLTDNEDSDEWWRNILCNLDLKYNIASIPGVFDERITLHKLSLSY